MTSAKDNRQTKYPEQRVFFFKVAKRNRMMVKVCYPCNTLRLPAGTFRFF